jgi:hypothetical protein
MEVNPHDLRSMHCLIVESYRPWDEPNEDENIYYPDEPGKARRNRPIEPEAILDQ